MVRFLHIIVFLIPFQFALSPLTGFDIALSRILILIATFILAIQIFLKRTVILRPHVLHIVLALFFLSAFVSVIAAHELTWFARKSIFLINFVLLYVTIIMCVCTRDDMIRLMRTLAYSAVAAAAITCVLWTAHLIVGADTVMRLWQTIIAPFFLGQTITSSVATYSSAYVNIAGHDYLRAVGLFPDPHVAAFFFELTLPFVIAFAIHARSTALRLLWACGTLVVLTALLTTFTRGAYIGLATAALATSLIFFVQHWHRAKRFIPHAAIFALFITLITIYSPIGTRVASISTGYTRDSSVSERLLIWDDAISTIATHPWLGVGLGNYPLTINTHADYRDPYYAHNLYLDLAVEMGLPTLLLWCTLIGTTLFVFVRATRHRSIQPFAFAGIAALTSVSAHGMFDTMIFSVHALPTIFLILACATFLHKDSTDHS